MESRIQKILDEQKSKTCDTGKKEKNCSYPPLTPATDYIKENYFKDDCNCDKIKDEIASMKREIREITKTVDEFEDHFGCEIPPDLIKSIKKLKDDMDIVIKKIQLLNDNDLKFGARVAHIESSNSDFDNRFKVIGSKVSNMVDTQFPGLSNEIETIRERVEIIKKGNEDGYNSIREMVGKLSGQYNNIIDKTNHDTNELGDRISETNDHLSSLKKRFDELPFPQQISNINSSLLNLSLTIKEYNNKINNTDSNVTSLSSQVGIITSDLNTYHADQQDINSELKNNLNDVKSNLDNFHSEYISSTKYLTDNIQNLLNSHTTDGDLDKLKTQLKNLNGQIISTNTSLTSLSENFKTIESNNKQNTRDIKNVRADFIIKTTSQDSKLNEFNNRLNELGPLSNRVSDLNDRVTHSDSRITSLITSTDSQINSLTSLVNNIQSQLQNYNSSLSARISSLESSDSSQTTNISSLQSNIKEIDNTLTSVKSTLSSYPTLQSDLNILKSSVSTNTTAISLIKESLATVISNVTKANSKITTLQSSVQDIQNNNNSIISNITDLKNSTSTNTTSIQDINVKISTLKSDVTNTQANVATNSVSISSIQGTISDYTGVKNNVTSNTNEINNLKTLISDYPDIKENILSNTSNINTIKSNLSGYDSLKTQVQTNTSNITSLRSDVDTLKNNDVSTQVPINTSDISVLKSEVDNLKNVSTQIPLNTSNIATLQASIGNIPSILTDVNSLKNDVSTIKTTISTYPNLENDVENIKLNVTSLTTSQSNLTNSQASVQSMFTSLQSTINAQITAIASQIASMGDLSDLQAEIEALQAYTVTNDVNMGNLGTRVGRIEAQLPLLKEAYEGFLKINSVLDLVTSKWTELDDRWALILPLFDRMTIAETNIANLQVQINNLRTRVESLEEGSSQPNEIVELQIAISTLQGSNTAILSQIELVLNDNATTHANIGNINEKLVYMQSEIDTLKSGGTGGGGGQSQDLTQLKNDVSTLKENSTSTNLLILTLQGQLATIQEEINSGDSTTTSQLAAEIETIKQIIATLNTGSVKPSDTGTMKWLENYNVHTGKRDLSITSIQDLNSAAQLYIDNTTMMFRGLKVIKGIETDRVAIGHISSTTQQYVLDVKGNSKFDGTINGFEINDLGRNPRNIQGVDVALNTVYSLSYSSAPNNIRILLDGNYPVKQSDTDGFSYWYTNGKINILTGTNSIGSHYDSSGTRTPKTSGKYHVSIY